MCQVTLSVVNLTWTWVSTSSTIISEFPIFTHAVGNSPSLISFTFLNLYHLLHHEIQTIFNLAYVVKAFQKHFQVTTLQKDVVLNKRLALLGHY
nr:hypothetical protein [Tanacetum cinerariifolium]